MEDRQEKKRKEGMKRFGEWMKKVHQQYNKRDIKIKPSKRIDYAQNEQKD